MALACRLAPAAAAAIARRRLPVLCRAASTKAAAPDAAETAAAALYSFQPVAAEPAVFSELLEPGRRAVLLAVDPDLNGALVALSWRNPAAGQGSSSNDGGSSTSSNGSSSSSRSSSSNGSCTSASRASASSSAAHGLPLPPGCGLQVELHDMPVEVWQYGSRAKRQPAASGLIGILQRYAAAPSAAGTAAGHADTAAAAAAAAADSVSVTVVGGKEAKPKKRSSSSSKKRGKGKAAKGDAAEEDAAAVAAADEAAAAEAPAVQEAAGAAAGQQAVGAAGEADDPPVVRAIMEYNMPAQLSGKFAWYGIGFASGLLNGLLVGAGIPYQRVHAASWKSGMGLRKQGKEGSIALACHLLPAAAPLLQRKKDHGRAEALLLAAYALGVRMQPLGGSDSKGADAADEGEEASEGSVDESEEDGE